MRLDLSRIVLGLIYLATTGVVALISDIGLVLLSGRFHSMDCVRETFGVNCQLAAPMINNKLSLMVFMLAGMFVYLVFRHRATNSNFAPFAMFLSAMLVACTSFDLVFGLPAHNISALFTSTVNTFSYILIFTFVVMVMIREYDPLAFLLSVMGSFTVKVFAFIALGLLMPGIPGATGMFALFVTYSFAAFGMHLMMACRLFVSAR